MVLMQKRIKSLKVHGNMDNDGYDKVPVIRVKGKWLEKYGFKIGQTVTLNAVKGNIIIYNKKLSRKELL